MKMQITKTAKVQMLSILRNGCLGDLEFTNLVSELCRGLRQEEVEDLTRALGARLGDEGLMHKITPEEAAIFIKEMTKDYSSGCCQMCREKHDYFRNIDTSMDSNDKLCL